MTRQFCDICGKEIYGNWKFDITFGTNVQALDVCKDCQKEFNKGRTEADVSTYRKIRKTSEIIKI